ncbi:MAG: GDP-mannose 4,6-dehydratase [Thaumarchaeota archaeon]|nr:GDP-mannose 4,6-dehydratase [Nitrososphaerota archaeon]
MEKESVTGKNIVVTGGAGFIGSHLCDQLLSMNPSRLVIIDDFSLGKERNIQGLKENAKVKVYSADASDMSKMENIFENKSVDVVFNLAVVPLPKSLQFPKETVDTNLLITTTMCELLRRKYYKTLISCSSSEAYGSALYVPMDENHPERPLTPYAASKIAGDHIAISYFKTFELDVAIARPFNTYGPRQNEGSYAGVIPMTIERILTGQAPIIQGDGLQTRDYSYVEDMAEALRLIYEFPETRGRIVNIASGTEITIKEIIDLIVKLIGYQGEIMHAPSRPGDVRRHKGDISLAKALIHYSPKTDFHTGLKKTIDWYKKEWLAS